MVTSGVQKITPDLARIYLKENTKNRRISLTRVMHYANAMVSGEWRMNGEPIIIAASGELLDGQHRLMAVVEADRPVEMLVVNGVESNHFDTIDQGSARSVADILDITGEDHPKTLAAAARWLYSMEIGTPFMVSGQKMPTATKLREIVAQNPGIRRSIEYLASIGCYFGKGGGRVVTPSIAGAVHYMLSRVSPTDADVFFHGFITGTNLDENSPIYKLRERLTAAKELQLKHLTARAKAGMMIKCWNAYRNGTTVNKLAFKTGKKPEEFPTPV